MSTSEIVLPLLVLFISQAFALLQRHIDREDMTKQHSLEIERLQAQILHDRSTWRREKIFEWIEPSLAPMEMAAMSAHAMVDPLAHVAQCYVHTMPGATVSAIPESVRESYFAHLVALGAEVGPHVISKLPSRSSAEMSGMAASQIDWIYRVPDDLDRIEEYRKAIQILQVDLKTRLIPRVKMLGFDELLVSIQELEKHLFALHMSSGSVLRGLNDAYQDWFLLTYAKLDELRDAVTKERRVVLGEANR